MFVSSLVGLKSTKNLQNDNYYFGKKRKITLNYTSNTSNTSNSRYTYQNVWKKKTRMTEMYTKTLRVSLSSYSENAFSEVALQICSSEKVF